MQLPNSYIKFLGFQSIPDFIENLYLKSLIDAYPKVSKIKGITKFDENNIRNEFQKIICFESGILSKHVNNNLIFLSVENQIINEANERKRTDIEFNIPNLKYVIECKKLKGISKSQYIDKGISRFINPKQYISDKEEYAGMCSFVVNDDVERIFSGTKERVKEYSFVSINNNLICDFVNSFSSTHYRVDDNNIQIHHLFFDMNIST